MFESKEDKLRKQLTDGIALHQKALEDLRASLAKAEAQLTAYRTRKALELKHEIERDNRVGMTDGNGAPVLPMAGVVFMPEADFEEQTLQRNKRFLMSEVARISQKLEVARRALASLK